ncbi:ATP-binding cassette domain-containing protein [Natronorubrum texcoconense]|uniref:Monosaccharide ABC transporter ATP-binding protein, CUT2 family n=1 Tax=Natronorubrum texcoconense TaxID=1095776 RepID=A0A1G9CS96_9EURY|nr:ATP-binding cassette domain-containing protein [Natronorubrum texcoconense]SDK54516.1 monosaccharide ABC transporter ATP-binding protein, CUT2 family [Natronorubrum texcoconense]
MSSKPIIRTDGLSKRFETVHAVKDVDFSAAEGEIMAVVGDNGAGKSTLIEMLCGVLKPTDGDVFLRGERVEFDDYNDAQEAGIGTVYQDLALAESQSVAANIFLGNEPTKAGLAGRLGLVDEREMATEASAILEQVKIPVDPHAAVRSLSGGQQQAVAIARALQFDPEILIMDEPTSALSIEGVRNVLNVVNDLRERGITIVLISHNIEEVLGIADRITVLHQGELMGVLDADDADREDIVLLMMGGSEDDQVEEITEAGAEEGSTA